jgi:GR25 family glycosyltransferase involved in LPS biosynthesis
MIYYYINLDNANLRKSVMENSIALSSIPFIRHEAAKGDQDENKNNNLTNGQWGCFLSHLQILNLNVHSNNNILILEDDSKFNKDLHLANDLISSLENNSWDLIYLDATIVEIYDYMLISKFIYYNINNSNKLSPSLLNIEKNQTIFGTHGYIINKNSIKKVTNLLTCNYNSNMPIDNIFCKAIQDGLLNAKILLPTLVSPSTETLNSQINNVEHPLMKDWINFRNTISFECVREHEKNIENYFKMLEKSTIKIIQNRMQYSFYGIFTP